MSFKIKYISFLNWHVKFATKHATFQSDKLVLRSHLFWCKSLENEVLCQKRPILDKEFWNCSVKVENAPNKQ